MGKVRVKLTPIPRPSAGQQSVVDGVVVSLARFGPEPSAALLDTPKPATLEFHAALITKVRNKPEREFERFATLTGSLVLRGDDKTPEFTGNGQPIEYDAPPGDDRERALRRKLDLQFDPDHFKEMLDEGKSNEVLILPAEPPEARFMEVDSVLSVDGNSEAPLGASARLDINLVVHTALVRLYDGNGVELKGVRFEARVDGALISEGTTDDDGIATVTDLRGADACDLAWSNSGPGLLHYRRRVIVDPRQSTTNTHLENLGFDEADEQRERILEVQEEFGIDETGSSADVATFLRDWHNEGKIEVPEAPTVDQEDEPDFTDEELEQDVF